MDMTFKQLYAWYIGSETWKAVREVRLKRDKRKCQRCGATERLHVHHLTYERFTHERLSDLITVCEDCHDYIHRQARENPRRTLEETTRRVIRELGDRRTVRQPQRTSKPKRIRPGKNDKCWCGQLVRVLHKHEPGASAAKNALPWETPASSKADAAPRRPSKHDPDFIWVCTKGKGWQREPRA